MLEKFRQWIKGMMNRMFNRRPYEQLGVMPVTTNEMMNAIELWDNMYKNNVPWMGPERQSLNLASQIAAEIAIMVTLEAKVEVKGKGRGEWLNKQLEPLVKMIQRITEYACATGGLILKPYPSNGGIAIDVVQATDFLPTAYDSKGNIVGAVFLERIVKDSVTYTRYESHAMNGEHYHISNKAYKTYNGADNTAGTEIPLASVTEWADLEAEIDINGAGAPLFAYFRIPLGNTIDPKNPLGVSIYSKAVDLIRDADIQYQRLMWEYEGSELAIDAPEDIFIDEYNKSMLPAGKQRLFRMNQLDPKSTTGKIMEVFSPTIRDESLVNGLNQILMRIENQTGLARGTLSDATNIEAKTAYEIRISRQRTYATVTAIQRSLESSLRELLSAMDTMATLYNLTPAGDYEITCIWDDSVVTDAETERIRDMGEVRDGLMHKWEYRTKWYGEDEKTAKKAVGEAEQMSDDELMGFSTNDQQREEEEE